MNNHQFDINFFRSPKQTFCDESKTKNFLPCIYLLAVLNVWMKSDCQNFTLNLIFSNSPIDWLFMWFFEQNFSSERLYPKANDFGSDRNTCDMAELGLTQWRWHSHTFSLSLSLSLSLSFSLSLTQAHTQTFSFFLSSLSLTQSLSYTPKTSTHTLKFWLL